MKIDSIIKLQVEILKKNGVHEIGYTKLSCIGYFPSSTAYLFWKKEKEIFVQKFKDGNLRSDQIKRFRPIQIKESPFFKFYHTNKLVLKNEKVGRYKTKPDSIGEKLIYSTIVSTAHSCHRNFVISENNEFLKIYFDYQDLQEYHDNTKTDRNISYDLNVQMKIVEWDKTISDFIEALESEKEMIEITSD